MRTFTAQVEALQRYRGKGQQKVTVEHVHVHSGGRADLRDGGRLLGRSMVPQPSVPRVGIANFGFRGASDHILANVPSIPQFA